MNSTGKVSDSELNAPSTAHPRVERLDVSTYRIPTDGPESDGTFEWNQTILVLVQVHAAGKKGLGYTFADRATASLIHDTFAPLLIGADALAVQSCWVAMRHAVRNLGRPGISSMAISAVDIALWDLKARLLDLPLITLLGSIRDKVPAYGSGGFTSYSIDQLQKQLAGWVNDGIDRVKMKIGREPDHDIERVCAARQAIGTRGMIL